ncbi:hypothetical protein ABKP09_20050 [Peribacillus frigoritolerans]
MKKATCLFCKKEGSTKNMMIQISLFKGFDQWIHAFCKGRR